MIADGKGRSGRSPYSRNRSSLRTQIRDTSIRRGEIIDDPGNIRIRDRRAVDLDHLVDFGHAKPRPLMGDRGFGSSEARFDQ
jgi:hypothetical protein